MHSYRFYTKHTKISPCPQPTPSIHLCHLYTNMATSHPHLGLCGSPGSLCHSLTPSHLWYALNDSGNASPCTGEPLARPHFSIKPGGTAILLPRYYQHHGHCSYTGLMFWCIGRSLLDICSIPHTDYLLIYISVRQRKELERSCDRYIAFFQWEYCLGHSKNADSDSVKRNNIVTTIAIM